MRRKIRKMQAHQLQGMAMEAWIYVRTLHAALNRAMLHDKSMSTVEADIESYHQAM